MSLQVFTVLLLACSSALSQSIDVDALLSEPNEIQQDHNIPAGCYVICDDAWSNHCTVECPNMKDYWSDQSGCCETLYKLSCPMKIIVGGVGYEVVQGSGKYQCWRVATCGDFGNCQHCIEDPVFHAVFVHSNLGGYTWVWQQMDSECRCFD